LKLDSQIKFVQYIKLAVQEAGLGREWVRSPRLPLAGSERESVLAIIRTALDNCPRLPAL
jgi:dihydrodipicolinate synthase/N-acetylneuraminate lyase